MSKNTRNRILLTAVAALLLVTMAVGGTMAWLSASTKQVVNTFTETGLDITLTESETEWKKPLLPGATYDKDPNVTVNTDSDTAAWVFVEILEEHNTASKGGSKVTYNVDTANWVKLTVTPKTAGATVYLYKTSPVAKDETKYILTGGKDNHGEVKVNGDVVESDMENLPSLTFYAYAVQSENLTINGDKIDASNVVDNAAAIWALAPAAKTN